MITQAQAKFFIEYKESFDDGEDPEIIRYVAKKDAKGALYITSYHWSVDEQRRIWSGVVVDEDVIVEIWQSR